MNYRFVANQLCALLVVLSAILLAIQAAFFIGDWFAPGGIDRHARIALIGSGCGGLLFGVLGWRFTRRREVLLGRREALLLVAMSWVVGSAFAALPYFIWAKTGEAVAGDHPFRNYVNCYFEAVSGLTTTGSSILSDIEAVPRSILLWRSATQWLGGIGIVVVFVAVLPSLGVGAKRLFFFETSGPTHEGILPTIRSTARALLVIYLALSAVETVALTLCGMSVYDAVTHTMTTLSTAGFSTKNTSVGAFNSVAVDIVITIFMVIGGVNFGLFYMILQRRFRPVVHNSELRLYLILVGAGTLIVALTVIGKSIITSTGDEVPATLFQSLRYALFNVTSVFTTTGYATADYNLWPDFARSLMFVLIFIGGSAGSTAGGLKVVRLIILFKALAQMIERSFRPHVVRPITVNGAPVDEGVQLATLGYAMGMVILLSLGTVLLFAFEPADAPLDVTTAASANLVCFSTTGPGFNAVGPVANFEWMTDGSKLTLCAVMLLGRLEIMAIIVLFTPRFWRRD